MNTPLASTFDTRLLGGLSPAQFLRDYWQKKPLLIRQAVPGFNGLLPRDALLALSARDDVESRFVAHDARDWTLESGPLPSRLLKRSRRSAWTVLVQGLNLLLPQAEALMRRFDFIPYARLDDVMVSYATDGGGVGPHFDNYDVFLLQGSGRRHWQISTQDDLTLIDGAPLKILKHFVPEQAWTLEPGDMLYLPPQCAHNGVAVGECTTYSIGFRTPTAQELSLAFLDYLRDRIDVPGRYADPGLRRQDDPSFIGKAMTRQVASMLKAIRWDEEDVENFLGCYLTEPKAHIFFDPPEAPLSEKRFASKAQRQGVCLDARTQLLHGAQRYFINGEELEPEDGAPWLQALARERRLGGAEIPDAAVSLLHEWYCAGFLHLP